MAEEGGAISPIVIDNLSTGQQSGVIDGDGAALAARGHILGGMEAEASHVPQGTDGPGVVRTGEGLRSIFDDEETVLCCQDHDGVHIAASNACVVDGDDSAGARRDSSLNFRRVEGHSAGFNVNKDSIRSAQDKGVDG